jgi:hypothetical protein
MAETVSIDRPSVAKPVSRPRSRKPAVVSASALALHLDCSRAYVAKLSRGVCRACDWPGCDQDAARTWQAIKGEHDEISNLVHEAIVSSGRHWKLARSQ